MNKIKSDIKNRNKQLNKNSKKIIISFAVLLFIYFITSFSICLLMYGIELPQVSIYYIVLISMIVSSFAGGFVSGKVHMKNGLVNGLLYNLPFVLLFLIISLILNNFEIDYKGAISLFSMLLSSAGGGIFSVNSSRKKR